MPRLFEFSSSRSAVSREQMRAGFAAPPRRQLRQRVQRSARPAAMIDQAAKGARTDIVAANEPQPVEPLLVGQTDACFVRVHRHGAPIADARMARVRHA
jgi:hypothetical protein